jgi:hypothetical protein
LHDFCIRNWGKDRFSTQEKIQANQEEVQEN